MRDSNMSESVRRLGWPARRPIVLFLALVLAMVAALAACSAPPGSAATSASTDGSKMATSTAAAASTAAASTTSGPVTAATTSTAAAPPSPVSTTGSATASTATPKAAASTAAATGATLAAATPSQAGDPPTAARPAIALTFDDGPSARDTGKLLDLLKAEQVPATFFVLGNQIDAGRQTLVKRAFDEGHEIGNHTYTHATLRKASPEKVREELVKTSSVIEQAIGRKPTIARPPTGAYDDQTVAIAREMGLALVNWSYQSCPEDWNHRGDPQYIADFVVKNAANGHIVLLHDTNASTMEAMPAMIKGLKDRGFRFMTVSQLLAFGGTGEPALGKVYFQYTVRK